MKRKLLLLPLAAGLAACAGCSSTNIAKLTKELARDPSIVVLKVSTIYGTVNLTRIGAQPSATNNLDVTIAPDGTVTTKK